MRIAGVDSCSVPVVRLALVAEADRRGAGQAVAAAGDDSRSHSRTINVNERVGEVNVDPIFLFVFGRMHCLA